MISKVFNKENLFFDVYNINENNSENLIGTVKFPLDTIEKQEEYDLELEIPDEEDEKVINAKINAKIRFIWSIYKYYQDLYTKSERSLQNYNSQLQKTYQLLDSLNEPMKYLIMAEEGVDNNIKSISEIDNKSQNKYYNTVDALKSENNIYDS